MHTRTSTAILALSAVALMGFAAASQTTQPADRQSQSPRTTEPRKDRPMNMQHDSKAMQECMKACGECASVCAQTAHHCLTLGGQHASPEHQALLRDCADICAVSVCFMARSSPRSAELCRECAEICNQCAAECDRMGKGDEMMARCAEKCRECARVCEKMAGAAAR